MSRNLLAPGDVVRSVRGDWTHEILFTIKRVESWGVRAERSLERPVGGASTRTLTVELRWGSFVPHAPDPDKGGLS